MSLPDFTAVDLGSTPGPTGWGPGPAVWDSPEGIPVSPLYTAADLRGVDFLDTYP
ncbi:MAG: methylmalonyl-CoA mutase, partial [Pseudonocardiales bacterium]|nr:methylmalonyl-CoA mutase [Pseudonocardiales bacterium]